MIAVTLGDLCSLPPQTPLLPHDEIPKAGPAPCGGWLRKRLFLIVAGGQSYASSRADLVCMETHGVSSGDGRPCHYSSDQYALVQRSHTHTQGGARTTHIRTQGPYEAHHREPERLTHRETRERLTPGRLARTTHTSSLHHEGRGAPTTHTTRSGNVSQMMAATATTTT
eukprot:6580112-Pyramimonas_sp.AAC.1